MIFISRKVAKICKVATKSRRLCFSFAALSKTLFVFLSLCIVLQARSQKQFSVFDWKADVTLNTYLVQKMHQQYNERRSAFETALSSQEALAQYQRNIKDKIKFLLTTFRRSEKLQSSVTGVIPQDGYRIEKVLYESLADHHVTANLYIPEGDKKFPAVLLFCGHEDASKATPSYQQTAILFAKNGFVVFVIDPVSQSERYQIVDDNGKPLTRGGTTEHTLLNQACTLLGTSLPGYELWDNIRGLDYLVTRKEVDTSRIGCLGNSGGGMQTIYFAGYDERIKVVAPCSYLETREQVLATSGAADGCAQIPNEGKEGLEMDDYLIAAAPKPLLILAGRYDFINYSGTLQAYDELKKVYSVFKQDDKLKLFTFDDGHGISRPKREEAVRWFKKWFYNDERIETNYKEHLLDEKTLYASATGNVNTSYVNEQSIVKSNLRLYDGLTPDRKRFMEKGIDAIRREMVYLFNIDTATNTSAEIKDSVKVAGTTFEKLIIRCAGQVPLPVIYRKSYYGDVKCAIWLNDAGKAKIEDSSSIIHPANKWDEKMEIIIADTRGTGETSDKPEMNDPKYYNKEYRNAMLSLHVGTSLVSQRVTDVLIAVKLAHLPVELNATGVNCIPALIAAVLNNKIVRVNLYNCPSSFRYFLEHPAEKNSYSYVLPGVANFFDIPDLIDLAGKEKITIIQ